MKKEKKPSFSYEKLYRKYFKLALILPALLFVFSLVMMGVAIQNDGTPIYRDVSLKGGLSAILTVDTDITLESFQDHLRATHPDASFSSSELFEQGVREGFIVDTDLDEELFLQTVNSYFEVEFILGDNYVSNFISPTLSNAFFTQALYILLISLVFMSLVIFLYFRKIVPSGAVIISVIFDLVVTIGVLNLLGVEISIAGIGALLMIIGYSVDTDVLLTNRLVKERGESNFDKLIDAWQTGTLMTITTLVAGIGAMVFTNSEIIFEIALILVVGLIVDYISTWVQNSAMLMWWLDKTNS